MPDDPTWPTFEAGYQANAVVDAILRSAKEQRWITISAGYPALAVHGGAKASTSKGKEAIMKVSIDKVEEGIALALSMRDGVTGWYLPQSYVEKYRLYEGKVTSISKEALVRGDLQTRHPGLDEETPTARGVRAIEAEPPMEELPILNRYEPLADSDKALEEMLRADYARLLEVMAGPHPRQLLEESRRAPPAAEYEWPVRLEDMGDIAAWAKPSAARRAVHRRKATGKLAVHILDVGQGDSVVIEFPDGQVYVVDSHSTDYIREDDPSPTMRFLRERNITEIDRLIITHPHMDHIYGITELLTAEDIFVKQLWMSRFQHPGAYMQNFAFKWMYHWMYFRPENRLYVPQDGDMIEVGGVKLLVLAPPPGLDNATEEHVNNASVVLKLVYGSFAMLLTGDAELPVWERMLRSRSETEMRELLHADVLKVSHHGSRTGTDATLLERIAPQQVVISVGRDNRFGHPHEEVLDLLDGTIGYQNVYRTDERGTISIISDGSSYHTV